MYTKIEYVPYEKEHTPLNDPFYFWEERDYYRDFGTLEKAIKHVLHGRKEKSIKKAFFKTYEEYIGLQVWFSVKPDYIITRVFSDENYIATLLRSEVKRFYFDEFDTILDVFRWLYKYYNEKEIFHLLFKKETYLNSQRTYFNSLTQMCGDGSDIIRTLVHLLNDKRNILDDFQKVKPKYLHDRLSFINNNKNIILDMEYLYKNKTIEYEGTLGSLDFKLPKKSVEFHSWAKNMKNCMFSRDDDIVNHSTIMLGVFKNRNLTYAIEIKNGEIIEAKGKYNKSIPTEDYKIIQKWIDSK